MSSRIIAAVSVVIVGGAISGAQAQQPNSSGQQAANSSGWTFNIAPYGWFANVNVTSNLPLPPALGGTVTTDSSIGFGNLLSHLNFAAMVAADAQYGRFSVLTDFMYLNVGGAAANIRSVNFFGLSPIPISGAVRKSAGANLNTKILTLAGGYTIVKGDWGNFDVIAGFRYLGIPISVDYSLDLALTGPRGNGATFGGIGNVSGTAAIWNGIGGFRGRIRLGDTGLFIPYYFDAGAGGSNLTWQIASGLGYQTGWVGASLTYRYLSFQQGSSAVIQHLSVKGPMLMASFTF